MLEDVADVEVVVVVSLFASEVDVRVEVEA
jgi:hypothetical protein